jgi:hypothetical protein
MIVAERWGRLSTFDLCESVLDLTDIDVEIVMDWLRRRIPAVSTI